MSEQLITSVVTVITAIVGVAIIAVLVSKQANTAGVIQAGAGGVSQLIGAAVSPVTGGNNGLGGYGTFGAGYSPLYGG